MLIALGLGVSRFRDENGTGPTNAAEAVLCPRYFGSNPKGETMGDGNQADATASTEVTAQLQSELNEFAKEWNSLRVEFSGEGPNDVQSISEWRESITRSLIIRSTAEHDFASAWDVALSTARDLIYSRLVPWSWKLLNTYGVPYLPNVPRGCRPDLSRCDPRGLQSNR